MRRGDGPLAQITIGPTVLHLTHRDLLEGAAELAVRPDAILLRSGLPGPGELPGWIRKTAYLGSHMEYEVALDGLPGEALVEDPVTSAPLAEGATVAAALDPAGAVLVPG